MNTSEHTSLADQLAQSCAAGLSDNEQATRRDEAEAARQLQKAEANVSRAIEQLVTNAGISGRANEPYLVLVNITDLNDRQPTVERLSDHQQPCRCCHADYLSLVPADPTGRKRTVGL
jgi:hypothetical protein